MFGIPEEHISNMVRCGDEAAQRPRLSLIEECGELVTALSKMENDRVPYTEGRDHILEELAHVLISANLVARLLDITANDINNEVRMKALKAKWDISNYNW